MHAHQELGEEMSRLAIHEADDRQASQSLSLVEPVSQMKMQMLMQDELEASGDADGDTDGGVPLPPMTLRISTNLATPAAPVIHHEALPAAASLQDHFDTSRPSSSHRNRSPYSRTHLRSRSSGAALGAPGIMRAHSSPSMNATARSFEPSTPPNNLLSPQSPMRSPARPRSPFRVPEDSSRPSSVYEAVPGSAIEAIQEDSELDINPGGPQPLPAQYVPASFSRSSSLRRRPASPLHAVTTFSLLTPLSDSHSSSSAPSPNAGESPSLGPQRFNENYPSLHHYASTSSFSSISSTPSSQRSRSPSISSLETIEDAPDLESKAIEAERIERLRLAAERAENPGDDTDDPPRPRGFGFGRGSTNRERKRWSVCGGERRADLDLETIYED